MLDLGSAITAYPPAAINVSVAHLRTSYPADHVMEPSREGHKPNDPGVFVPGAYVHDLPSSLGHDEALAYVVGRLAAGSWRRWLSQDEGNVP